MKPQQIDHARRRLLGQASSLTLAALLPGLLPALVPASAQASRSQPVQPLAGQRWLSATGKTEDSYALSWYQNGQVQSVLSGFRGHGCAVQPGQGRTAILVGRRPGTECLLVDLEEAREIRRWQTQTGYHLNGHAVYSADGLLLFVAESADDTEQGTIAVYDAVLGSFLTRWPTHGLEPHEIRLSADGLQLIIAHGGLQKDGNGKVLNLNTMQSAITILDARSGQLLQQINSPVQRASLRHMDVASDGTVAVAAQIQGETADQADPLPLAWVWRPGEDSLTALDAPLALTAHCRNYMGSVAICGASNTVGFTSPKGDLALFWDLQSAAFKGYHRFHDVCGLATDPSQSCFVLSNSDGWLRRINSHDLTPVKDHWQQFDQQWDNHLLRLSPQTGPDNSI